MANLHVFKRTAVLAFVTAAAAVTLPVTAEAQSGSRICGNYWEARSNGQSVGKFARVLEVPKADAFDAICLRVISQTDTVGDRQLPGFPGKVTWNPRQTIRAWTCEDAGALFRDANGNPKYGADPCLTMNRVDAIGQVDGRTPTEWVQVY